MQDHAAKDAFNASSPTADYYAGKTIFVTGATGMLGIALCEKLIRCTHVARIYALVREGSGLPVDAQTRLQRQWQEKLPSSCAARLIESRKIVALIGDVALHRPFLGMSQSDMDTVKQEAHIVIHSAADISLLKSVHQLANINIHGAMRIAELAQSCVLLERYIHVSSLFSQSCWPAASEDIDIWPTTDGELRAIDKGRLLFDAKSRWYMNYAYTKHLAERLIAQRYSDLPFCIFRPSCIGPAMVEPTPMWSYQESMPLSNYLSLAMKLPSSSTLTHSCSASRTGGSNMVDEVPIDYVVNSLISHIAAGTLGPVNCDAGSLNPQTIRDVVQPVLSRMPQVKFETIPMEAQVGLAKIFIVLGIDSPLGSSQKTLALQRSQTVGDKQLFPMDLQSWDLQKWQSDRGGILLANLARWSKARL